MIDTVLPSQVRPIAMNANEEGLLLESRSLLMSEFIEAAHRAAITDATILLGGDSGTGKSAFAHQMHKWSGRGQDRFLIVDCAALSEHVHEIDPFEALRNSLAVMNRVRGDRGDVSDADWRVYQTLEPSWQPLSDDVGRATLPLDTSTSLDEYVKPVLLRLQQEGLL